MDPNGHSFSLGTGSQEAAYQFPDLGTEDMFSGAFGAFSQFQQTPGPFRITPAPRQEIFVRSEDIFSPPAPLDWDSLEFTEVSPPAAVVPAAPEFIPLAGDQTTYSLGFGQHVFSAVPSGSEVTGISPYLADNSTTPAPTPTTRTSLSTPSNQPLGWVSYDTVAPDSDRLRPANAPSNSVGARRHKGRLGPLSEAGRAGAAEMRTVGVCANCKRRKTCCDACAPCGACLNRLRFGKRGEEERCRGVVIRDFA